MYVAATYVTSPSMLLPFASLTVNVLVLMDVGSIGSVKEAAMFVSTGTGAGAPPPGTIGRMPGGVASPAHGYAVTFPNDTGVGLFTQETVQLRKKPC